MQRNHAAIAIAATLLAATSAFAAGPTNAEYFPFQETAPATSVGTSNAAATSNPSTTTDARTMGAQGTANPVDRSAEILMYLKAGS